MVFSGEQSDSKSLSDLLVAQAFGNQSGDFYFTRRQIKLVAGFFLGMKDDHREPKVGYGPVVDGDTAHRLSFQSQFRKLLPGHSLAGLRLGAFDQIAKTAKPFRIDGSKRSGHAERKYIGRKGRSLQMGKGQECGSKG